MAVRQPTCTRGRLQRVGFGLTQDLSCDWRRVAFAEGEELQEIGDRVAFGPPEVHVRQLARPVANLEQQRGDGVGNRGALAAKHAEAVHLRPVHDQHLAELRRIAGLHLEKQHRIVDRDVMRIARLAQLVLVLLRSAPVRGRLAMIRTASPPFGRGDERGGQFVRLDAEHAQLGRTQRP